MNDPLISIVIPVYKVPYDSLRKCLDSIAEQTSDNFEALMIDDGSPDDCGKICEEYAKKYRHFRVLHQENGGLSVVRNNGVENALGQWVSFVDGDDWIEAETVEFAENYIRECSDADVLVWESYYDIDGTVKKVSIIDGCEDGKLKRIDHDHRKEIFDLFFPRYDTNKNRLSDMGSTHARLYRKAFLDENKIQNQPGLKKRQDNVFNLWVFEKAQVIYYKCKRLYHYSYNEAATSQKYSKDNVKVLNLLYESMNEFVIETHNDEEFHQRLYCKMMKVFNQVFRLNYTHPDNKDPLRVRLKGVKAAFLSPNFCKVIKEFDPKGQGSKILFIYKMLKKKHYLILMCYYTISRKTQIIRMKLR